jgi:ribose transport system permease protein
VTLATAAGSTGAPPRPRTLRFWYGRNRGLLIAAIVFILLFAAQNLISPSSYSFFDFSYQSGGGATQALAAMGQTLVVLSGGFDLSAGAVISLVNVVLASSMQDTLGSQVGFGLAAIALGGLVGAFNGFFIAVLRLQSIVVTLSTMFIIQGVTLLIMDKPGGQIPQGFIGFLNGTAIPNLLPAPIVVLAVALLLWGLVKGSRLGTALYAIGSDREAAGSSGIRVVLTNFLTYVLAGCFYGAAGAFISAQTGSADPLVGAPLLLEMFAAVVVGGTALGGGRGGCLGSVIGAYILMIVVNILLVLNVSAYYSTVAEGVILILAVLGASLNRDSAIASYLRLASRRLAAWRGGTLPRALPRGGTAVRLAGGGAGTVPQMPGWWIRHRETLRYAIPAYAALVLVLAVTLYVYGGLDLRYLNSLLVLSCFLSILSLGQGSVILTGGLDLSVPWTIGLCGILLAGITNGANLPALWAVPLVLAIGAVIGLFNGAGVVLLGLPPIVITLATNGILQGFALVYSNGTPAGFAPSALRWLMTGSLLGPTPVIWLLVLFVIGGTLLLGRTAFGRRIYAVGNSARVAYLSGVNVGRTLIGAYVLSGLCAALVGILLAGFNGQASLGMGDEYLLPSIAVVVVGGALITGGRGHYLGMIGGVLLLTALQTLLAGTTLPHAVRDIIFGLVVLSAVLALRDRQTR